MIQQAYNDLYVQLRKFIWDIGVISQIVDIELNAYSAFPDIELLKNQLSKLRTMIYHVYVKDEDLQNVFENFTELLDEGNNVYVKLYKTEEVVQK